MQTGETHAERAPAGRAGDRGAAGDRPRVPRRARPGADRRRRHGDRRPARRPRRAGARGHRRHRRGQPAGLRGRSHRRARRADARPRARGGRVRRRGAAQRARAPERRGHGHRRRRRGARLHRPAAVDDPDRDRVRARPRVPADRGRVPLPAARGDRDGPEPAVGRRHLRRARRRLPAQLGRVAAGLHVERHDRQLDPAVLLRDPVRPVDGLHGAGARAHPRGAAERAQPARGGGRGRLPPRPARSPAPRS